MPYDPALRTPQADIENRLGIQPLEELLAERDALIKEVSMLRALHGSFGTWDDKRRVLRSTIAMKLRAKALESGTKVTEAWLEDAAQSDPDYVLFISDGTNEKARWHELENRIQGINDMIMRGQAISRFVTAELGLEPRA